MLYACDHQWWLHHKGAQGFSGLKISQDESPDLRRWNVRKVTVVRSQDKLLVGEFGVLGWGGNGGFHALNLAVQFGASKIVLVGYDMRLDRGMHWHGKHEHGLNNPTARNVERWRRAIDDAAPILMALEIKVINVSPISMLQRYPKMSLESALAC